MHKYCGFVKDPMKFKPRQYYNSINNYKFLVKDQRVKEYIIILDNTNWPEGMKIGNDDVGLFEESNNSD